MRKSSKDKQMQTTRLLAGSILCSAILAMTSPAAFAWGCVAQGSGTSFGYSHSYDNRSDAESRALAECRQRGSSCVIVSCDRNK